MDVLISGAGPAGLSLAHLLAEQDWNVTVVELAPSIRNGGSPIDVRGGALGVAARMGILRDIQEARVRVLLGSSAVDAAGNVIGAVTPETFSNEHFQEGQADIELHRASLNDALLKSADLPNVELRFDTTIEALEQDSDGVLVTLIGGQGQRLSTRFDIVVGADGLHSNVRRLAFGPESEFVHHLGFYISSFGVDQSLSSGLGGSFYNTPGRMCGVTDYGDRVLAGVVFRSAPLDYDYHDTAQQKAVVGAVLDKEQGWKVAELRSELAAADDFYFDSISLVKASTWSRGRIVLCGDAAHCSALLSGMGTSLGMLGAALLADELANADGNYTTAFQRYEQRHRPDVLQAQASVGNHGDIMVPETQGEIDARNAFLAAPGHNG